MEENNKKKPLNAEELEQMTGGIGPSIVLFDFYNAKFRCRYCDQVFPSQAQCAKHEAQCPKKVQIF